MDELLKDCRVIIRSECHTPGTSNEEKSSFHLKEGEIKHLVNGERARDVQVRFEHEPDLIIGTTLDALTDEKGHLLFDIKLYNDEPFVEEYLTRIKEDIIAGKPMVYGLSLGIDHQVQDNEIDPIIVTGRTLYEVSLTDDPDLGTHIKAIFSKDEEENKIFELLNNNNEHTSPKINSDLYKPDSGLRDKQLLSEIDCLKSDKEKEDFLKITETIDKSMSSPSSLSEEEQKVLKNLLSKMSSTKSDQSNSNLNSDEIQTDNNLKRKVTETNDEERQQKKLATEEMIELQRYRDMEKKRKEDEAENKSKEKQQKVDKIMEDVGVVSQWIKTYFPPDVSADFEDDLIGLEDYENDEKVNRAYKTYQMATSARKAHLQSVSAAEDMIRKENERRENEAKEIERKNNEKTNNTRNKNAAISEKLRNAFNPQNNSTNSTSPPSIVPISSTSTTTVSTIAHKMSNTRETVGRAILERIQNRRRAAGTTETNNTIYRQAEPSKKSINSDRADRIYGHPGEIIESKPQSFIDHENIYRRQITPIEGKMDIVKKDIYPYAKNFLPTPIRGAKPSPKSTEGKNYSFYELEDNATKIFM